MNRRAGYSLLEVVVAMAIFGILIFVLMSLTKEMALLERRFKLDFLRHPQIIAVISRLRRDVADGYGDNPYLPAQGYTNDEKTLVITMLNKSGGYQTAVWDFSTPGVVIRRSWSAGEMKVWRARGVPPEFTADIKSVANPNPNGIVGVRVRAFDKKGRVAIDQIFYPRRTKTSGPPDEIEPAPEG